MSFPPTPYNHHQVDPTPPNRHFKTAANSQKFRKYMSYVQQSSGQPKIPNPIEFS